MPISYWNRHGVALVLSFVLNQSLHTHAYSVLWMSLFQTSCRGACCTRPACRPRTVTMARRWSPVAACIRMHFGIYECTFPGCCSSSGSRVMCRFVEKCWKRQNLTFGDLWWPDLLPDLKIDRSLSVIIFDALSIAANVSRRSLSRTCLYVAQKPS